MRRVNFEQQSPEWHAWRRQGLGASDAPIIAGVSPWCSPYRLWLEKTGRQARPPAGWAAARGQALEGQARADYERETGRIIEPACIEADVSPQRASLDGITFDDQRIVEIKWPSAADHADARAGRVPAKYLPQVDHQLICVSSAEAVDYYSCHGNERVCVVVERNADREAAILEQEHQFWSWVTTDTPPPLSERDEQLMTEPAWCEAAARYRAAKAAADAANAALERERAALIDNVPNGIRRAWANGVTLAASGEGDQLKWRVTLSKIPPV